MGHIVMLLVFFLEMKTIAVRFSTIVSKQTAGFCQFNKNSLNNQYSQTQIQNEETPTA